MGLLIVPKMGHLSAPLTLRRLYLHPAGVSIQINGVGQVLPTLVVGTPDVSYVAFLAAAQTRVIQGGSLGIDCGNPFSRMLT